ncbi:MAG TPA: metalloregulator ArsR/SmtB family transcription factor [Polyangiaceae bacterium]|nr:metalloregulator ArsR/SmtB family transcription factor [Polyangiaceae bacterium]
MANSRAASRNLDGFAALSDPTRRLVFERIARRPQPVGRLAEGLAVTRPAVSQHLKVLKDAGLVAVEARGTLRVYRLDPKGVEAMKNYLDRFWDEALSAFKEVAEAEENEA